MFNGKKERQLEEELEKEHKQCEAWKDAIHAALGQKEKIGEQLIRTRDSLKTLENGVRQVQEKISEISEKTENSSDAAADIHSEIIKMNNVVESFDANHSVFLGKLKEQNEQLMQLVETNREVMPALENMGGLPEKMKEDCKSMDDAAKDMQIFAKNMSVKSLNAAIEAGKLGESGSRFVEAAEEIRNFSQQYDYAAGKLAGQLEGYVQQAKELSEQIEQVKDLFRKQTAALGTLAAASLQGMADYKAGQLELHGILQDSVIGKSDLLLQSGREMMKLKDNAMIRIENMQDELNGQRQAAIELDRAIKTLFQALDIKEIV